MPEQGFQPTFFPWNDRQRPKVLDMFLRTDEREHAFTTTVTTDMEAAVATGHVPLRCLVALKTSCAYESPDSHAHQDNDLHKYSKKARRRPTRRRWPNWREVNPGQFASLIPGGAWRSPRAAAPKGRLRQPTPFDDMEKAIAHDRRVTRDRTARKVLSKWLYSARLWQRRWRYEAKLVDMTLRKQNAAKGAHRPRPDLRLGEPGTTSSRTESFRSLWQTILAPPPEDRERELFGYGADIQVKATTVCCSTDFVVSHLEMTRLMRACSEARLVRVMGCWPGSSRL